ncbi:MAG: hypothetical protein V4459_03415 [Pseudomonadota bacterium]
MVRRAHIALEYWLEAERDQLPLWLPVALGAGITAWFVLLQPAQWFVAMLALGALGLTGIALARHDRASRALAIGALTAALGIGLAWWRADSVAAPVLARPAIVTFTARVEGVEPLPARDLVRVLLAPIAVEPDASLPSALRRRRPGPSCRTLSAPTATSPGLGPACAAEAKRAGEAIVSAGSTCLPTSASTSQPSTSPKASPSAP